ncbi:MAG: hypothetical protein QXN63_02760 [Candidatus Bathyarchaeia archaeon]
MRRRLDNVLAQLTIIRQNLDKPAKQPFCCITFHRDEKVSCDVLKPLLYKQFLKECEKCRKAMKISLQQIEQACKELCNKI